MTKRNLLLSAFVCFTSYNVFAGGLLTNTNQSASFLRNPSRDAIIDIDGVYTNPAGVAFMSKGFHLGLTLQNAKQQRNVTTTFPTLGKNVNFYDQKTRKYEGDALAPVVPSIQAAYVSDRWSVGAAVAIGGGGGKCEFEDGIGSFETPYSLFPTLMNSQLANVNSAMASYVNGYSMDMYMKGRQYYWNLQVGGTYKITDNLAVGVGGRFVLASCSYKGYVRDIKLYSDPATEIPAAALSAYGINMDAYNISLNTDQSGLGFTPFLSVDWKINEHWNLAAKYEFKTRMRLHNHTKNAEYPPLAGAVLAQFDESKVKKVAEDIPGIVTVGAQYSPIPTVRINGGFHYYDDTHATRYGDKHKTINHGTTEITAGVEWDIAPFITVSAGYQKTNYDLSDEYMNDMSFNNSSHLLGLGCRLNVSKTVSVDLGYMRNFYKSKDVTTMLQGQEKKDHYKRENRVFAVGVNMTF
jgi:long-chain fatty acid transport protein